MTDAEIPYTLFHTITMRATIPFFVAGFWAAAAAASNVIDLTPANFDEIVGTGKPALVEL